MNMIPPNSFYLLSDREKEVLKLVAKGYTNKKIGLLLGIKEQTVETHRKHIKAKLKAKSTIELLVIAQENDLV
jgi:DNA-binding CsgD family transcriptional regulator